MRYTAGVTAIISGLLLFTVPRYILPACEYEGFSRMHCSDTAQAELVVAGLFILAGAGLLALKPLWAVLASGCLSMALSVSAFVLPDIFGYCQSSKMPCNYGMVPAIRLIGVVSGLVAAAAIIALLIGRRRKSKA
jgi:hypothetical protein